MLPQWERDDTVSAEVDDDGRRPGTVLVGGRQALGLLQTTNERRFSFSPRRVGDDGRATAAQEPSEGDTEPLLEERIQDRIDGRVEPQQPEDDLEGGVGNAEPTQRVDEGAHLEWRPRE